MGYLKNFQLRPCVFNNITGNTFIFDVRRSLNGATDGENVLAECPRRREKKLPESRMEKVCSQE